MFQRRIFLITIYITQYELVNGNLASSDKRFDKSEHNSVYRTELFILIIIIIIIIHDINPGSSAHSKVVFREILHPIELD